MKLVFSFPSKSNTDEYLKRVGLGRQKTCWIYRLFEKGRSEEDRALLLWGIVTCCEVCKWAYQFSQWKFGTGSALVSVKRAVIIFFFL